MEDWYLERLGHQNTRHHLNFLLGEREKLTIGRKAGGLVDVVCNGKTVSREHCVLKYLGYGWSVEDLKSMNGVFVNKNRIPAGTPITLREGDKLGVGAFDSAQPDYYVFNVLRNTVKDENENGGDECCASASAPNVDPLCDLLEEPECRSDPLSNEMEMNKSSDDLNKSVFQNSLFVGHKQIEVPEHCVNVPSLNHSPIFSAKILSPRQGEACILIEVTAEDDSVKKSPINSNLNQQKDSQVLTALSNKKKPSLEDVKLKLDCRVVIERLPKGYWNDDNTFSKCSTKKPLKGKKRLVLRYSDSDSGDEDKSKNIVNHDAKNSLFGVESKGKSLKKPVHRDERKTNLQDSSEENLVLSSNAPSVCKVPKSRFVVEKIFNYKEARTERRISSDSGRSSNTSISPTQIETLIDIDSDDCAVMKGDIACGRRNDIQAESDDDVIILSSGDEETFSSQPRFKQEPLDSPIRANKEDHRDHTAPLVNGHVSSSSDEDSPFFPELSQAFLKEIEEEEETNLSKKISTDVDKLNSLVKSGRFNQTGKTTLQIEPKTLHRPFKGRFTLATAGDSSRRGSESESAEDNKQKNLKSSYNAPRVPVIPCKPATSRKRKSANAATSLREKLLKQQGMESHVSVNKAMKKPKEDRTASDQPRTSENQASVPGSKFLTPKPSTQVPKEPKSSAPIPVKAKVTTKSRGDLFLKDLVGGGKKPKEGIKIAKISALSGFNIPKLSKTSDIVGLSNGHENSNLTAATAQKRKYPGDDVEQAVADTLEGTSTSYTFKKPFVRVAWKTSVSEDGDKNEVSPGPVKSHRYKDRTRDEARPLGKKNKLIPSKSNRKIDQEGRELLLPKEQLGTSNDLLASSNPNDETIPLPIPDVDHEMHFSGPISNKGVRGILKKESRSSEFQKKVSIVEENNKIHEIEPRPPTPPIPAKTPVRPVDRDALTNDILYRICNWCYDWIEEQKRHSSDEPPPLLKELKRENCRNLPELPLVPVVSTYHSLESYCSIFAPLMLHETWASLCKEIETSEFHPIKPLIYSKPKLCDGFGLLQCEALSPTNICDMDLVTLNVQISLEKPPVKFFGVVEHVVTRNWRKEDVDQRLLETLRPNVLYFKMTFVLWIKMSNIPKELDKIFTVTKIARLNTIVKQFILNAELAYSPLCDVILHPSDYADTFKLDDVDVEENSTLLNPSQYKAVESITRTIVCASDREPKVALLQGPPGTGKSHVIIELISRMMCMHFEKTNHFPRILVCAPSNNAIDEIANRLMLAREARKRYNVVRIGVTASMHPNVVKISLDELTKKNQRETLAARVSPESSRLRTLTEELHNLQKTKKNFISSIDAANKNGQSDEARMHGRKLEQLEIQIEGVDKSYQDCYKAHVKHFNTDKERHRAKQHVILHANIICTTLNSCRSREMENLFLASRKSNFLCCILDEASQCTEPESLTPLAFGISKFVLIGDPDQLPATVTSQIAAKNRFDQSLFNRFYSIRTNMEGVMMLNTQYRMAPAICEWPSKYFYGGKLITDEKIIRNGPCYDYRYIKNINGYDFHAWDEHVLNVVDGFEEFSEQSFKNEKEASLVAKIVMLIVNSPLTRGKSVSVITFYRSQQHCIIKKLNEEGNRLNAARVEVNTVDSFQGREKDIVIVSCVRARDVKNLSGDIGFVSSLQRVNVALTRAKESLIVCGQFQTLKKNETWQDLFNNAQKRGVAHVVTSSYTSDILRPLIMRPPGPDLDSMLNSLRITI